MLPRLHTYMQLNVFQLASVSCSYYIQCCIVQLLAFAPTCHHLKIIIFENLKCIHYFLYLFLSKRVPITPPGKDSSQVTQTDEEVKYKCCSYYLATCSNSTRAKWYHRSQPYTSSLMIILLLLLFLINHLNCFILYCSIEKGTKITKIWPVSSGDRC